MTKTAMEDNGKRIMHPFGPLYNGNSRILILGSFPSVKSREQNFFYGHPQNRFWKVLAALFDRKVPQTIPEKKALILENGLALWDSIASCVITGSSDASIREVRPNDLRIILDSSPIERIYCNGRKSYEMYGRVILNSSPIERIYCNGKKSYEMYEKYIRPELGREAVCLPSTSPANAQWSMERLTDAWSVLKNTAGEP